MLVSDNLKTINYLNCKLLSSEFVQDFGNILLLCMGCHTMAIFFLFQNKRLQVILAARKTSMSSFNKICSVKIRGKRRKVLSHLDFFTSSIVAVCHFDSEYLTFF